MKTPQLNSHLGEEKKKKFRAKANKAKSPMELKIFLINILLFSTIIVESKSDDNKLHIGVKKRVDDCTVKSKRGDLLHLHYVGALEDGVIFDTSYPRDEPFTFTLGSGLVIPGWDKGLVGMCEGEKRRLVIPPSMGYGESGAPPKIPGGATLIFDIELMKIERKEEL